MILTAAHYIFFFALPISLANFNGIQVAQHNNVEPKGSKDDRGKSTSQPNVQQTIQFNPMEKLKCNTQFVHNELS